MSGERNNATGASQASVGAGGSNTASGEKATMAEGGLNVASGNGSALSAHAHDADGHA